MEIKNGLLIEQRQTLSAGQVQSLNILAYTNQELDEFLTNEYLENPLLECAGDKDGEMLTNVEHLYEKGTSYRDHYLEWEDEDSHRQNDIAAKSASEQKIGLLMQLYRKDFTEREWKLLGYLVECLDEDGFFPYQVSDISKVSGYPEDMVAHCLEILKDLEPAGIFSKDLSECLQKQLLVKNIRDEKLMSIIQNYMGDIMKGHIGVVSRSLGLSTAAVKKYIHLIGTLNPRPFMDSQRDGTEYIVPDIIVTRLGRHWDVQINDGWMGEYKYSDYYIRMMNESRDPELINYFRERLERARFVVTCVEQRRHTLLSIVQSILEYQDDYFQHSGPLRPMCLNDIAGITQMHISTVSRAIRGKYIQYRNVSLLKDLFSSSLPEQKGKEDVSSEWAKSRIREIIQQEDRRKPLSDQKIVEKLKEEGISLSRRTAAKYREGMGIADSRLRS